MVTARLQNFLLILAATVLPGLLWPLLASGRIWLPGLIAGALLALADWFFPAVTAPLWRVTRKFGHLIGQISSLALMATMYIALIVPLGLLLQFFSARPHQGTDTYFIPAESREKNHMRRMF